jgi:hypothetical protein
VDAGSAADRRRVVAVLAQEARAAHHVDVRVAVTRVDQLFDLAGIVLAVGVHLHHQVVPALQRVREAGLHRAPDAEVERQPQHLGARPAGARACLVGRSVVDDEHVPSRRALVQGAHDAADGVGFVVGGNDGEPPVEWQIHPHAA